MTMTKPAGVFLQLLSIPVMLAGCADGLAGIRTDDYTGWVVFALGAWMLWAGGKPARQKNDP